MKNVKKINIFIPYFLPDKSYGGPITSIFSLSKFLSQFNKISIYTTALFYDSQKIISSKLINNQNFSFYVNRSKNHFTNIFSTLLSLLKKKNEIIYINSFFYIYNSLPFFLVSKFCTLNGNKLIISPRAELQPQKIKLKKFFLKRFIIFLFKLFASKEIIFISASDTELSFNKNFFNKNKHLILPNLPRFNNYFPFKRSSSCLKFLYISRIHPEKGLHFFLYSLLDHKENLPIEIHIKGSISNKKYFDDILSAVKNLTNRGYKIFIEGHVEVTMKLLSSFDVMVLPSIGENFSHCIVEASQSGLFCLISDKTPWFKNTIGSKKKLTCLSLDNRDSFVESVIKLINLDQTELSALVEEQQSEVKTVIDKSFNDQKKFFTNL